MQIKTRYTKHLAPLYVFAIGAIMSFSPVFASEVDPALALAVEEIWQGEAPASRMLSSSFTLRERKDTLVHEPDVRNGINYISQGSTPAQVEFLSRRFDASDSPWGGFPHLNTSKAQLTQFEIPRKNYLVLSAPGTKLFDIADWSRFEFLHVLDVTRRNRPVHYPLVAEGNLGTRVLGRLPGSSVLNYARLVPSQWRAGNLPTAYEITLYGLEPKGPQKVLKDGLPVTYTLTRRGTSWILGPGDGTPVTDERDALSRPFTSRPTSYTEQPEPDSIQQGQ